MEPHKTKTQITKHLLFASSTSIHASGKLRKLCSCTILILNTFSVFISLSIYIYIYCPWPAGKGLGPQFRDIAVKLKVTLWKNKPPALVILSQTFLHTKHCGATWFPNAITYWTMWAIWWSNCILIIRDIKQREIARTCGGSIVWTQTSMDLVLRMCEKDKFRNRFFEHTKFSATRGGGGVITPTPPPPVSATGLGTSWEAVREVQPAGTHVRPSRPN